MYNRMMSRLTLVTLLGATLTGASLMHARADDDSWKNNTTWKDDADDFAETDAAPVSYPQAAPGSLNLYHWKDYTETNLKTGSVVETRYWRQAKLDKLRRERMNAYESDEQRMMLHRNKGDEGYGWDADMIDPAPMSYPQAAPGGLHLYHWTDYTHTSMSPGSAQEARWMQREKREQERRKENKDSMMLHRDMKGDRDDWDANMIDPAPVSYPEAAPGALNLYHWTDYTHTSMAPNSAEDARETKHEKMEKMRKEEMKQSSDSSK